MLKLYSPEFTWTVICIVLSLTGVRGDGNKVKTALGKIDVNSAYNNGVDVVRLDQNPLERNRRALQEIYLLREKKENEDPMNYLSKLYSDMEESTTVTGFHMNDCTVESIVDPPQIELHFHKKVPNCANEFNITKIIELVDDDKRQRKCPCTCLMAKIPDASKSQETVAAKSTQVAVNAMQQSPPTAGQPGATITGSVSNPPSALAVPSSLSLSAVTNVVNATTSSPLTGQKVAEPGAIRAPKIDQSKLMVGQKRVDDNKQKLKALQVPVRAPLPAAMSLRPNAPPTPNRVAAVDMKKGALQNRPQPPSAAVRPVVSQGIQGKNMIKPQQIQPIKPAHSKAEIRAQKTVANKQQPLGGKLSNSKQLNAGWDLNNPNAIYPLIQNKP